MRQQQPSTLFPYTTLFRSGRLHFHAVHFMRTLPTGSVDPNFGRRVRNRRQLNSLQNTWRLRSEERFSRNAETDLVCRLLLEKKKNTSITHAYSIVIGSKHITYHATGGGFLTSS